METEIWKDIPGYEGYYQVSNYGRIKSFKTNPKGFIMKQTNKNGGYFTLVLQGINKPSLTKMTHRLVAELFIENPLRLPFVNHKDMNKQNNHYSNLEWVTIGENIRHAIENKPSIMDGLNYYNKYVKTTPIIQKTLDGVFIEEFANGSDAEKKSGVCRRNILQVANKEEYKKGRTRKQAGGYIWELKQVSHV